MQTQATIDVSLPPIVPSPVGKADVEALAFRQLLPIQCRIIAFGCRYARLEFTRNRDHSVQRRFPGYRRLGVL